MKQTLLEIAQSKGKRLLIEQVVVDVKPEDIIPASSETGQVVITEAVDQKDMLKVACRGILRNVPVHRVGIENLNGRIYPMEIEQKILGKKWAENTLSLADHPDKDDGSVSRICGVWKNYKLSEDLKTGVADWYLVGDLGQLIFDTVRAGGKVGVSRVGYGNIDENDKKTVKADDYELVRLGDAVITPSASVYADVKNYVPEPEKPKPPSYMMLTNKKENVNEEPLTEKVTNTNKELNSKEVKSMDAKINEYVLKNQLNEAIRVASKATDLKEAIETVKSIDIPVEFTELKEKAALKVVEFEKLLEEQNANTQKVLAEKVAALAEVEAKLAEAQAKVAELTENYEKAKAIVEKTGVATDEEAGQLTENVKTMSESLKIFQEDTALRDADIAKLLTERKIMKSDIDKLIEDRIAMTKDIKSLKEEKASAVSDVEILAEKLFEAESWIKDATKELTEGGYVFEKAEEAEEDKEEEKEKKEEKKEKEDEDKDEMEEAKEDSEEVEETPEEDMEDEEAGEEADLEDEEEMVEASEDPEAEEDEEDAEKEEEMVEEKKEDEDEDEEEEEEEEEEMVEEFKFNSSTDVGPGGVGKAKGSNAKTIPTVTADNVTPDVEEPKDENSEEVKAEAGFEAGSSPKMVGDPSVGGDLKGKKPMGYGKKSAAKEESRYRNPKLVKPIAEAAPKKVVAEKKSVLNHPDFVKDSILEIYQEQVQRFPMLKDIKKEIFSCKSPFDASRMIIRFTEQKNSDMSPAGKKESLTEAYVFTK